MFAVSTFHMFGPPSGPGGQRHRGRRRPRTAPTRRPKNSAGLLAVPTHAEPYQQLLRDGEHVSRVTRLMRSQAGLHAHDVADILGLEGAKRDDDALRRATAAAPRSARDPPPQPLTSSGADNAPTWYTRLAAQRRAEARASQRAFDRVNRRAPNGTAGESVVERMTASLVIDMQEMYGIEPAPRALRSHEQRDVPHNYKLCLSDGGPPGGSSLPCPICRYTRDCESGKLPDVECSATACHARFHKRCLGSRTHERIMEKRGGTSCCPLCLSIFRFKVKTTA